jgi:hypothetical protein
MPNSCAQALSLARPLLALRTHKSFEPFIKVSGFVELLDDRQRGEVRFDGWPGPRLDASRPQI